MKALVEMENSGLVSLLRDDKYEDLGRMYSLFKRVDGGLALIRTVLSDTIKENGRHLVQVGGLDHLTRCKEIGHTLWVCGSVTPLGLRIGHTLWV